ncbi:MAG: polysaccharide deacetylase family protein [bacterium]
MSISILTIYVLNKRVIRLENDLQNVAKNINSNKVSNDKFVFPDTSPAPFKIVKPSNGAMVLTNRIDIEGEAGDNQIVSLIVDGKIKAVTLPEKGTFLFKNIAAKRGSNTFTVKSMNANGEVATLETINIIYNNPTIRYLANNVTRGSVLKPKVALTFDGGYVANASEEILNILKEKNTRCTFFLTGTYIKNYPHIVRRIVADGHEVGNHTWSHPHLTTFTENSLHLTRPKVNREFLENELKQAAAAFTACTGEEMAPFWRAPYGEHNLEIREWAAELGYRHIEWTVGHRWESNMDTMDWVADTTSPAYRSADEILDKILSFGNGSDFGANGAIIIMHLGTLRNNDFPHKKLPEIIDGLREQGYQLVTISEMVH